MSHLARSTLFYAASVHHELKHAQLNDAALESIRRRLVKIQRLIKKEATHGKQQ